MQNNLEWIKRVTEVTQANQDLLEETETLKNASKSPPTLDAIQEQERIIGLDIEDTQEGAQSHAKCKGLEDNPLGTIEEVNIRFAERLKREIGTSYE